MPYINPKTNEEYATYKAIPPSKPKLLSPVDGYEISNLNPVLNIQWEKSTDTPYVAKKEIGGSGGYGGMLIPDNEFVGGVLYPRRYGPIAYIQLSVQDSFDGGSISIPENTIYAELLYVNSYTNGQSVVYGDLIQSGYLDKDGRLEIEYDNLVDLQVTACAIRVKKKSGVTKDYYLDTGRTITNPTPSANDPAVALISSSGQVDIEFALNVTLWKLASFPDTTYYFVDLSLDNGSSWENLYIGQYLENLSYDFSWRLDDSQTYQAKIRIQALDDESLFAEAWETRIGNESGWTVMDGVFTVIKHVPPYAPTKLKVSNTGVIDRSLTNRLSWKYSQEGINNRQGSATIQWRKQGDANWNDIYVNGLSQFYDVPANTFPLGVIEWQVKTTNDVDMEGPYSDLATFTAKDTPVGPTISAPLTVVDTPTPTISWIVQSQIGYEIEVETESGVLIWTEKNDQSGATSVRVDQYLDTLATFNGRVRVKNSEELWTQYTILSFSTDYHFPAIPYIMAEPSGGCIKVTIQTPEPVGNQVETLRNEVYKIIDGEWIRLTDSAPDYFNDYSVGSGTTHQYKVRAIGTNGSYVESRPVAASIRLFNVWMHLVSDPEGTIYQFKLDQGGKNRNREPEYVKMKFKGRNRPVIEIGDAEEDTISFSLFLTPQDEMVLNAFYDSRKIVCYRDSRGRLAHGMLLNYNPKDESWGGYSVDLDLEKIDYIEGI